MGKHRKPDSAEVEEFRRAVGPVREIRHDRVVPSPRRAPPRPLRREPAAPEDSFAQCSDTLNGPAVQAEDRLYFARDGVRQRQLQQLRRGQLAVQAELDLHGMTSSEARTALGEFVAQCAARRLHCVCIIHGKGAGSGGAAPVLKNRLNAWLRQHPQVLAFSSARPRDGGAGALYVLLRSTRD